MSNVLEVILPLDSSEIRLPPRESRSDEEELYLEYLEVNEGSGYLSAMDSKFSIYLFMQNIGIALDKRNSWKLLFLFLNENICCGYSLEASH